MTSAYVGRRTPGVVRAVLCAAALATVIGCNGVTSSSSGPPVPSADVPIFTPVAGCQPTQFRGGLSITVSPVTYAVQQRVQTSVTQTSGPVAQQMPDGTYAPINQPVQQTTSVPYLQVMPDRIVFAVTIANNTQHVFRSQGAVAQLSAYGQPLAPGPSDSMGLSDLILLPQNQQQILVYGPQLQSVAPNTPITLTLYDVVTATDMAGNPAVRQSFSWAFNYTTQCQTLDQLQAAGPPQAVVQQYDQSAGPTYVVVPVGSPPPPRYHDQPQQQQQPRPQPKPVKKAAPPPPPPAAVAPAVDPNATPTSQPATPPKKKKKN